VCSQSKKRNIYLAISSITEDCTLYYYRSGIKIEELRAKGNAEIKSGTERNFPVIWRILVGVPLYSQPLFRSLFLFFFLFVFPASCRIHVSHCRESEVTSCVKRACDARQDVSPRRSAATHTSCNVDDLNRETGKYNIGKDQGERRTWDSFDAKLATREVFEEIECYTEAEEHHGPIS